MESSPSGEGERGSEEVQQASSGRIKLSEMVLETRVAMSKQEAKRMMDLHRRVGMPAVITAEAKAVLAGATRWPDNRG